MQDVNVERQDVRWRLGRFGEDGEGKEVGRRRGGEDQVMSRYAKRVAVGVEVKHFSASSCQRYMAGGCEWGELGGCWGRVLGDGDG